MAHIVKREGVRGVSYMVRFRTPDHKYRGKTFKKKRDAERYLATLEADKNKGLFLDPARGRVSVETWAQTWLDSKPNIGPTTRERYEGIIAVHLLPRWGKVMLCDVDHVGVQRWVADMTKTMAPASVQKNHGVLRQILGHAVKDQRIARNPAVGVTLPRLGSPEKRYLTHTQVTQIAELCGPIYGPIATFLAYTGLRWGEMAALTVSRLDLERRRITVAESVTPSAKGLVWGPTKGHERREVALPGFLVDSLRLHVAGKRPADLIFVAELGGVVRSQQFQRQALNRAAEEMGLARDSGKRDRWGNAIYVDHFEPHEFRHTAASLAIASGADVKVVQRMLGHKSASLTLDLYGHLYGDRLETVADAMEAARNAELGRGE